MFVGNTEKQHLEEMKSSQKISTTVQVNVNKILHQGGNIKNRSERNHRDHMVLYSEGADNRLDVECNGLLAKAPAAFYLDKYLSSLTT